MGDLIGVDGCADGWICLHERQNTLSGRVLGTFNELLQSAPIDAIVANRFDGKGAKSMRSGSKTLSKVAPTQQRFPGTR